MLPSAGRKYDRHISRVASENSPFPTQKIDLYASIYSIIFQPDQLTALAGKLLSSVI